MKRIIAIFSMIFALFALAACEPSDGMTAQEKLDEVYDTMDVLIGDPSAIKSGFTLPTKLEFGVIATWTSEDENYLKVGSPNEDGDVSIAVFRPNYDDGNKEATLTATLKVSGRTKIWSIDLTILHLDEFTIAADNFEEVMTAENTGKTIVISSVGLHAKQGTNGIYLTDSEGFTVFIHSSGYSGDIDETKVYQLTAEIDNYYGTLQLKDVNLNELDGVNDYVVVYEELSLEDVTNLEKFPKPGADHVYNHVPYKFKDVKIIIDGTGNYNTFLVDKSFNVGVDERNAENSVMLYYVSQIDELRALAGVIIEEIDIILEGFRSDLLVWYFSYVLPMGDIKLAELTDADRVMVDKNSLTIVEEFAEAGTLELPTEGGFGSTISWDYTVENNPDNELINLETGAITIPEEGRVRVKLTATITNGDAEDTKIFEISIGEYVLETVAEAVALETGKTIMVEGVITDKFANNTYGLQDNTGSIAVYYFDNLELGKKYKLVGEKDLYNGLHQLKNIEIESVTTGTMPDPTPIDDIIDDNEELEKLIAGRVSITGAEVTFVGPLSGNAREVKIKKNDVELTIRYDKRIFGGEDSELLAALEVGDIVNYIGNLGWFNNPQLGYGPNTFVGEGEPEPEELPVVEDAVTIAEFLEESEGDDSYEAIIVGVITSLAPYNSYSMEDGTAAVAFRIGGKNSSNVDFEVGDVVIAKVKRGVFNGLIQAELVSGETHEVVKGFFETMPLIDLNEDGAEEDFLIEKQSRMVKASAVEVLSKEIDKYGNVTLELKLGDDEFTLKWDARVDWVDSTFIEALEEGDLININGATINVATNPILMIDQTNQVTPYVEIEEETVKLQYTAGVTSNLVVSENNAEVLELDPNIFNVISNKAGSYGNAIGINKDGSIRLYFDANGGNVLTVEIDEDYVITEIKIKFLKAKDNGADAKIMLGNVQANNTTKEDITNKTITFSDLDINDFSIQNVNSDNVQLWIDYIEITYQGK